jgi:chromosome segregation ATPase
VAPIPIRGPRARGCAILTEGVVSVVVMATTEDRLRDLEVRVDHLETWAGPGQAGALAEGLHELRAEFAKMRATQDRHTRMLADLTADVSGLRTDVDSLKTDVDSLKADVAELKTDVAELKADMADVKGTLQEILRRLPPPPSDN